MSSVPTPYTRKANFVSYEGGTPNNPKRGTDLDAEFDAIKLAADSTQSRLAEIQRTDGKIANDAVHIDALSAATRATLVADSAAQATAASASATGAAASASASAGSASAAATSATAAGTAKTAAETARDTALQATTYTGPDTGSVDRTLRSKLGDVVSAKDFGAIGDGVADDTSKLQAALDTGRKVLLPEGATFLTSGLNAVAGGGLIGNGTLKLRAGAPASMINIGVTVFTIDGIILDGNAANMGTTSLAGTEAAIKVQAPGATALIGVVIRGVRIARFPGDGIVVNGGAGTLVSGNRVNNVQGHGIIVAGGGATSGSDRCVVNGNAVNNTGAAGIILMGDNHHCTCTGNTVQDWNSSDYNPAPTSNGDGITGYDVDNDHITVAGNVVINTGKAQGGHGIHLGGDNCVVSGNTIKDAPASGIYFRSQGSTMFGGAITGNSVYGGGTVAAECGGIFVRIASGITVTGNSIQSPLQNGILLQNVASSAIGNNSINAPGTHGIRMNDSAALACSRNVVGGNVVLNPTEDGIRLDLASDCSVHGNTVVNANLAGGKYHIYIADAQARNSIKFNHLRDGGTGPKIRFPADNVSLQRASGNMQSSSSALQDRGAIAAAATIRLDEAWDVWIVSSTATIATINGGWDGRIVTLIFSGAAGVNETGNVALGGVSFTGAANKVLQLVYHAGASKWVLVSKT